MTLTRRAVVGALLAPAFVQPSVARAAGGWTLWNKPGTARYITPAQLQNPDTVAQKISWAIEQGISWGLLSGAAGGVLSDMAYQALTAAPGSSVPAEWRSRLVPGFRAVLMASGYKTFIPNIEVGKWAGVPGAKVGAWKFRTYDRVYRREVYIFIPDVDDGGCGNVMISPIEGGQCVPCATVCSRECAAYAREFVS